MSAQIFKDSDTDRKFRPVWYLSRGLIYGVLILWAIVCLFQFFGQPQQPLRPRLM